MYGKPIQFKPLKAKMRKAEIQAELVHFRRVAGIPTKDTHFNDLGLTVADLRVLHAKCLRTHHYPMGHLEYVDLIVAAKQRHDFKVTQVTYERCTIKWLKAEWTRLKRVLDELYPGKRHSPRRIA